MSATLFFAGTFVASALAGVVGSLLGLGGGVIVVPFLTLVLGINIHYAIGASIVSVIATSSGAAAAYVRERLSNIRVGMFLEMATTTGAVTGAVIAGFANPGALSLIFGLVLGYSALLMFRTRREELPEGVGSSPVALRLKLPSAYEDTLLGRKVEYAVTGIPLGLFFNYLAGIISGLLGIGSGTFKVLAMDIFMRLPMKVSTATSNFMIGVTAAASAGIYFLRGDINPVIASPVALGVLLGSVLGTRLLPHLHSTTLKKIFFVVLLVVALQMVVRGMQDLLPLQG